MGQQNRLVENERIHYIDNIRYLMVLLVVVIHVTCAYTMFTPWWPVNDKNAIPFNIILIILDVILMPTLFFISGYFALYSIRNKNALDFVKVKSVRLGLPWLIGVILLSPINSFIYMISRNYNADFWVNFISASKKMLAFYTGTIEYSSHFHQSHLWYISLLLLFLIVFAVSYKLKQKLIGRSELPTNQIKTSSTKVLLFFALAAICTTILSIILYKNNVQYMGREPWFSIASIIQFQPTRIAIYIICFILGIFAFHKQWFVDGKTPLHPIIWGIISIALLFGILIAAKVNAEAGFNDITKIYIYIPIRTFAIFSTILALFSLAGRYWQSTANINLSLANNSYIIYLIHMPIVFAFQLILLQWDASIYLKFFIGSIGSIALSYLISEYAIRRYPKRSVAAMFGLFAIGLVLL